MAGQRLQTVTADMLVEEEEAFEFDWAIEGFSNKNGCVRSGSFMGPKERYTWSLGMHPKQTKDGVDYISVFVDAGLGLSEPFPKVRAQLSLHDGDEGRLGNQTEVRDATRGRPHCFAHFGTFIPRAEVMAANSRWLDQEGTLTIHCCIWIKEKMVPSPSQQQAFLMLVKNKDKTLEDLGHTLLEGDFADVTLVTNTKTFTAHKAILAARSKVFAAMFKSPMTEEESGSVKILDFDEEAVEGMLQHMYKGQVDNVGGKARSLLQIADKYDLPGLKEETEYFVVEDLKVETAAEDLVLAHMVNAAFLKTKVTELINRNKKKVKSTEAFQRVLVSNPRVLLELLIDSWE